MLRNGLSLACLHGQSLLGNLRRSLNRARAGPENEICSGRGAEERRCLRDLIGLPYSTAESIGETNLGLSFATLMKRMNEALSIGATQSRPAVRPRLPELPQRSAGQSNRVECSVYPLFRNGD